MLVLGIETTCDETAASVVEDGHKILSNIVFSQEHLHKKFGGVYPELASRSHIDKILIIIDEAIAKANLKLEDLDLIAVAKEPGLIGSLLIGLNTAKTLSLALKKPFIGINHVEAHLYASMMGKSQDLIFPALGVVISGGHTMLLKILDIGQYELIGTTIDDAIGECFDKVASILDLPYPGGPQIEKLAIGANSDKYKFKCGKINNNPFDFSFSGLKTKVLYTVKGQSSKKDSPSIIKEEEKKHIAASFQRCAFEDLIEKSILATKKLNLKAIYFGGGVSNNQTLRDMFEQRKDKPNLSDKPSLNDDKLGLNKLELKDTISLFWPAKGLSLDNAAMIAGLGYHKFKKSFKSDNLNILPQPISSF